jgi:hypothetical protein
LDAGDVIPYGQTTKKVKQKVYEIQTRRLQTRQKCFILLSGRTCMGRDLGQLIAQELWRLRFSE